jgi:hypothetical protein
LDDDVKLIAKKNIKGLSEKDADLLKRSIREELPLDEYPNVDFKKIDDAIDSGVGKKLTEKDLKELKDYIFDNPDFKPPHKAAHKDFFPGFEKNAKEWGNLVDGKIDGDTATFLKHELAEMRIKNAMQYDKLTGADKMSAHMDAHDAVLRVFNTQK